MKLITLAIKVNQAIRSCILGFIILLVAACGASAFTGSETKLVQPPPPSLPPNPSLYTGEQIDPDLGMYYLRARYYQPALGRFWNMDSFEGRKGSSASSHKFGYCYGNPINGVDPSGHDFSVVSIGASMSLVGQVGTHELRGGHAALIGARAMFGADDTVNSLIYGLEASLAAIDAANYVAAGAGAIYVGCRAIQFVRSALAQRAPHIVYRALRVGELDSIASGGGISRGNGATTATQHVLGAQHANNPFVSTTRSLDSAEFFATHGGTRSAGAIVAIDLNKVSSRLIDVSTIEKAAANLNHPRAINFSAKHQELLIQGNIPSEAIVEIIIP